MAHTSAHLSGMSRRDLLKAAGAGAVVAGSQVDHEEASRIEYYMVI